MKVKIKKLDPNAVIPARQKAGDAGYDLVATSGAVNNKGFGFIEYGTGLAFEIPEGFVGKIYPRSSLSKKNLMLCNHVAIIDSNYRGEVKLRFKEPDEHYTSIYAVGDRIGQLIIEPVLNIEFEEVEELGETERGDDGFGSSGS